MDWDDIRNPGAGGDQVIVGEKLDRLSVAELDHRIIVLEREIERVRGELKAKREHENRAASIFKT